MEVLFRKFVRTYVYDLKPQEMKFTWETTLFRFYAQPELQSWALASTAERLQATALDPKLAPKQYIFEFDKNYYYYSNKREEASFYDELKYKHKNNTMVAIDTEWRPYFLSDLETRKWLNLMLNSVDI